MALGASSAGMAPQVVVPDLGGLPNHTSASGV